MGPRLAITLLFIRPITLTVSLVGFALLARAIHRNPHCR